VDMAPPSLRPQYAERRFAQLHERTLSQAVRFLLSDLKYAGASMTESDDQSASGSGFLVARTADDTRSQDVVSSLPGTTAALVGVCTFFGIGLLLIIGWRVRKWKRKKIRSPNSPLSSLVEKSTGFGSNVRTRNIVFMRGIPDSPGVVWQPAKITPWVDTTPLMRPPAAISRESFASTTTCMDSKSTFSIEEVVQSAEKRSLALTVVEPKSPSLTIPVSSHRGTLQKKSSGVTLSPLSSNAHPDQEEIVCDATGNLSPQGACEPLEFAIVTHAFPATLPDELDIKVGENLRLLRVFKDGWSLCQRTGSATTAIGVVPLCCLASSSSTPDESIKPSSTPSIAPTVEPLFVGKLKRSHSLGPTLSVGTNKISKAMATLPPHYRNPRAIRLN